MKESVKNMCDYFIEDFDTVKKECGFLMTGQNFAQLCAFLFSANGKRPNPQQIKACAQSLKEAVGNALCFGDAMLPPTACILSMHDDAEQIISGSIANYHMIKKNYSLVNAKYTSLSGLIMELMNQSGVQEEKASRSKALYDSLKQPYPMTYGICSVLSVLLAYSEKSDEEILKEVEWISEELNPVAGDNARQFTALLLTYYDKPPAEKTGKLCALYKILAEHKPKYPNKAELLCLTALSMFGDNPETIAANIIEVFDELGERKGYKGFLAVYDASARLAHAVLIVLAGYLAETAYEPNFHVPAITAVFLPTMHFYDKMTAAIMAGHI